MSKLSMANAIHEARRRLDPVATFEVGPNRLADEWQKTYLRQAAMGLFSSGRELLLCSRQVGKELALFTPIKTATGWTTMGDIQEGDYVFNEKGQPTKVLGVWDTRVPTASYRITFSDGTSIVASDTHSWTVVNVNTRKMLDRKGLLDDWMNEWASEEVLCGVRTITHTPEQDVPLGEQCSVEGCQDRKSNPQNTARASRNICPRHRQQEDRGGPVWVDTHEDHSRAFVMGAETLTTQEMLDIGLWWGVPKKGRPTTGGTSSGQERRWMIPTTDPLQYDSPPPTFPGWLEYKAAQLNSKGSGKVSENTVYQIKGLWDKGVSVNELAKHFEISRTCVRNIINSKSWSFLPENWEDWRNFQKVEPLLVDPYVLGVWLGDGSRSGGTVYTGTEDVEHFESELSRHYPTRVDENTNTYLVEGEKRHSNTFSIVCEGLSTHLTMIGLRGNKHIPRQYLRAGVGERVELLRGLMDTDGGLTKSYQTGKVRNCSEFTTVYPEIRDGFLELARSLGLQPKVSETRATLYGKDCGPKWRIRLSATTFNLFKMPRKANPLAVVLSETNRNSGRFRYVESIERVPDVPMRCITVDNPTGLYLAGEGMIPTHNSEAAACLALWIATVYPKSLTVVVSTSMKNSGEMIQKIRSLADLQPKPLKWVGQSKLYLDAPSGARIMAVSGGGVRGFSPTCIIIDEAAWLQDQDEVVWQSCLPAVGASKGAITALSSSSYRGTMFERLWSDPTSGWNKTEVNYRSCPRISPEFIEEQKRLLTKAQFDCEYENVFIEPYGADYLFNPEDIERMMIRPEEEESDGINWSIDYLDLLRKVRGEEGEEKRPLKKNQISSDPSWTPPPVFTQGESFTEEQKRARMSAKLKEENIPEIFRMRKEGMLADEIAEIYKVSGATIRNVLRRKTWPDVYVPEEYLRQWRLE